MVSSNPGKPASDKSSSPVDNKQSIESVFLDYLRAVHRAYTDSQKKGVDTYQGYQREVSESYTELQKRAEDLQREYVGGVQEAFGKDDANALAEKAYRDAISSYRQLVEDAQRQSEQINKKLTTLLTQQGEDLQKQYAAAFKAYFLGLQTAIQQLDNANLRVSDLDYLSRSVGTVALYAGATAAMPN